ncbi:MAG: AprI/Inh family metalloprotease inhibitor [Methylovirgula sp.]
MKTHGSAACLSVAWLGILTSLPAQATALSNFVARSETAPSASDPQGESYARIPVQAPAVPGFALEDARGAPGFGVVEAAPAEPETTAPPSPAKTPPKPSALALEMRPADIAARYALERAGGKDAGCLLILDNQTKAAGGYKATLAPGCRDQGIMIFDPIGWRLVAGHLVLTARRGYTTHLDLQVDGTWQKDPSEGEPLSLKKL